MQLSKLACKVLPVSPALFEQSILFMLHHQQVLRWAAISAEPEGLKSPSRSPCIVGVSTEERG